jgi:hypothetical protein
MTREKIMYYIGKDIFEFINSLTEWQLLRMKKNLLSDMNLHAQGSEILFKRTVELEYINERIRETI